LPYELAAGIYTAILVASLAVGLRLLGVRDWRCYGVALLSMPVYTALSVGTLTPLLFLGTAAAWRYRDRKWVAASAVAGVVLIKIFLWPLILWLVLSRRRAAALLSVALGAAASVASWWIIGFAGFAEFPGLLRTLSRVE
jgi:alpha-1,2-mannosyltransferase